MHENKKGKKKIRGNNSNDNSPDKSIVISLHDSSSVEEDDCAEFLKNEADDINSNHHYHQPVLK